MGCHTWFYKPAKKSQLEVNAIYVKEQLSWLKRLFVIYLQHIVYKKTNIKLYRSNWIKDKYGLLYPFESESELIWAVKVTCRKIKMVIKGYCQKAIYNHLKNYTCIEGKLYSYKTAYHDCFRVYGYPDDVLHSYEEYEAYITTTTNKIYLSEESDRRVKQFFTEHPQGVITFG